MSIIDTPMHDPKPGRHSARADIAAIAPTLEEARRLAKQYGIPPCNAIAGSDHSGYSAQGRRFAGYILLPGYLPAPAFWQTFELALAFYE